MLERMSLIFPCRIPNIENGSSTWLIALMLTYCTFNFSCPFSCTRKIFHSAHRTLIWTSPNKTNGWSYASVTDCQSGPARETSDKLHRCSTIPPNRTTLSASQVLLEPQPQARAHKTGGFLHHLVLLRCSHRNWSCPGCRT